eukprot:3693497-Prymnesium_polylepis.1
MAARVARAERAERRRRSVSTRAIGVPNLTGRGLNPRSSPQDTQIANLSPRRMFDNQSSPQSILSAQPHG